MGVGDHMYQFPDPHIADLSQHMHQHGVLHHIPVVCRQHILGALV